MKELQLRPSRPAFDPAKVGPKLPDDLEALASRVIDAALTVHTTLGPGFSESVYEHALCLELTAGHISYCRQYPFSVTYRDVTVGMGRIDILVNKQLVLELKATDKTTDIDIAQTVSYLKAMDLPLGLILNFGLDRLKHGGIKRIVI